MLLAFQTMTLPPELFHSLAIFFKMLVLFTRHYVTSVISLCGQSPRGGQCYRY